MRDPRRQGDRAMEDRFDFLEHRGLLLPRSLTGLRRAHQRRGEDARIQRIGREEEVDERRHLRPHIWLDVQIFRTARGGDVVERLARRPIHVEDVRRADRSPEGRWAGKELVSMCKTWWVPVP